MILRVPDGSYVESVAGPVSDATHINDFDTEGLRDPILGARHLLAVVNDGYRPTPTKVMLEKLQPVLKDASEVRMIVATGMHPAPADIGALIGPAADRYATSVHDASRSCTNYGDLTNGDPLELNDQLEWADTVLLLGSVEPHFFAGFTGGAKQLLPGLASKATIEANHRHAVHSGCRPCNTSGNPVAAPIREVAARFSDKLWSLQAVAGPDGWEMFCGREATVFAQATQRCRQTAMLEWPESLDVLIAVVDEPLDRNLYQLQKGFENHQWAVRDGGHLLLISSCRDGVGNAFFAELMARYPEWQNLPPWDEQPYSLGLHKLYRTSQTKKRIGLHLYSTLAPQQAREFWFEPVEDLDRWLSEQASGGQRVGVVHDAAASVSEVVN